jgi:hypothetical protein
VLPAPPKPADGGEEGPDGAPAQTPKTPE